jgi:vacuolar-type H+-ATPase subunit I/STV1
MARWFRSEPMEYISLIVNEDAAHDCLADLGKLGVIQFSDVSEITVFKILLKTCERVDDTSRVHYLHSPDRREVVSKSCLVLSL